MKKKLSIVVLCLAFTTMLFGCKANEEEYIQDTYATIKKTIAFAEDLENDYFAQYYDLNNLTVAKESAQDAVDNSKEESYDEVLNALETETQKLNDYLTKEKEKLYNEQTSTDITYEFPFEVPESSIPQEWFFAPETKQSSAYPTWVISNEAETTDGAPIMGFYIDDSSAEFSYAVNQIPTKEIQVMDEDGEIQSALVNTELKCTVNEGYQDPYIPLNERPAYLVICNGQVKLLLQSYEGDEYYVPYIQS